MSDNKEAFLSDYFDSLRTLLDHKDVIPQIMAVAQLIRDCAERGGVVNIVGNGGSAAIASHIAIDLTKNAGFVARTFSDAAEITCLSNDYGFDDWLSHALRLRAGRNDCLIAISSSGRSPNILKAVGRAKEMHLPVVVLSGMDSGNPLRKTGDIELWADSSAYNIVETIHQFWLMSVIDLLIGQKTYKADQIVAPIGR